MIWPFRKKPVPSPKPKPEPRAVRVSVHLRDGTSIAHRARFRTIKADGTLQLHDEKGGGFVVADYAPGTWISISCGKRCVQPGKNG
jgi:hypothetical protein